MYINQMNSILRRSVSTTKHVFAVVIPPANIVDTTVGVVHAI